MTDHTHSADYVVRLTSQQMVLLGALADKEMQRITRSGVDAGVAAIQSGHASLVHKARVALRRAEPYNPDEWVGDPDFQDWLNDLMEAAPDCWDDDSWMGELATQYVRHLEAEVKRLGGSLCQDHCDAHIESSEGL